MGERSFPWRGPGEGETENGDLRERMSPQPNEDGRLYQAGDQRRRLSEYWHPRTGHRGLVRADSATVTTAGPPGAARGKAVTPPIAGVILSVHVSYAEGLPGSTSLRVTIEGEPDAGRTLLALPNHASDGYYAPNAKEMWRPATGEAYQPFVLPESQLTVWLHESDARPAAATVTVFSHDLAV